MTTLASVNADLICTEGSVISVSLASGTSLTARDVSVMDMLILVTLTQEPVLNVVTTLMAHTVIGK